MSVLSKCCEVHVTKHIAQRKFLVSKTDMCCLMMGIRSEKRVVWRFRRCVNVIQCTYTNLDSIAYCTPSLYGIAYCS